METLQKSQQLSEQIANYLLEKGFNRPVKDEPEFFIKQGLTCGIVWSSGNLLELHFNLDWIVPVITFDLTKVLIDEIVDRHFN